MDFFKTVLTVLLVAVLAAEALIFFQVRRLIHSWGKEVEEDDKALTDEEQRYVEIRLKLMSALSTAAIVLFLLRFVVIDLLPLMGL
ncbi:MAG: hypothetical protein IKD27_06365 [Oscillospiraceae bacterium]|nr:hypothetical protein [Oscillospiraceae bacterium]